MDPLSIQRSCRSFLSPKSSSFLKKYSIHVISDWIAIVFGVIVNFPDHLIPKEDTTLFCLPARSLYKVNGSFHSMV